MTRVVWFQDYNPLSFGGGAQLTDRAYITEGLKQAYDIIILTPELQNQIILTKDDFLVYSNTAMFDPAKLAAAPNKYAVFHHDWVQSRCKWRLYFPMSEKCMADCPHAPIWKPVLEKAVLNIFLSPLHYRLVKEYFGDSVGPYVLAPSVVNPDHFFDHKKPGRKGTCSLNGLITFKGRAQQLEYAKQHSDESITFGGDNDRPQEPLPPNCKFVGPVAEGNLPKFYNEFEWFNELPDTPQPMNRTAIEARLCGLKVRTNALLGAASWPWFTSGVDVIAQKMRDAPGEFWKGVESVL